MIFFNSDISNELIKIKCSAFIISELKQHANIYFELILNFVIIPPANYLLLQSHC